MYKLVYNIVVLPLLLGGLYVLRLFLPKIRAGLAGRKKLLERVQAYAAKEHGGPSILFHCASAGELEALRPLAAALKQRGPRLALSYFSPSAEKPAKQAVEFDFCDYSPVDTVRQVRQYLEALGPSLIVITKHDVWPNLVWTASELNIPVILINGNFHPRSLKTRPLLRGFHRAVYGRLRAIYTVSTEDAERARLIAGKDTRVEAAGDSRFDRVVLRRDLERALPEVVATFCKDRMIIVGGSTHDEDEKLLIPAYFKCREASPSVRLVIVPHDPSPEALERILTRAGTMLLVADELGNNDILVINKTGILADLYRCGQIAFVGGAFGKGVHSVLEPMAWGLPVLCGPHIAVANEARQAQQLGLLKVVNDEHSLTQGLQRWAEPTELATVSRRAREFVEANAGVTARLAQLIQEQLSHAARGD